MATPERPLEDSPHRVPITEHFEALLELDRGHARDLREADKALAEERDRRYTELREADQTAVAAALAAAEKAVQVAKVASDAHLKSHNDVVEAWKADRQSFITREQREEDHEAVNERFTRLESFQSRLLGGIGVIAFIGLANLAKIWLS